MKDMRKKTWVSLGVILMAIWFMGACSKKLMPPEIESTSSVAEGQMDGISDSYADGRVPLTGLSEEGVASGLPGSGSPDIFREEDWAPGMGNGLNGSVGGPNAWAPGSGRMPGSGSAGQFFAGAGDADSEGIQEARLLPFTSTGNLSDIHFKFDRYDLDEETRAILRKNVEYLKQHRSIQVEIQGHCDERGTNNYNTALAQRRAVSTKSYLVAQGISASRLHTISYGEEKPFCFESNQNCWWQNRRAHFMVSE